MRSLNCLHSVVCARTRNVVQECEQKLLFWSILCLPVSRDIHFDLILVNSSHTHTHIQYTMHAHATARKHSVPGQSASNSLELKHSPLSQCGVACAGSVPVVSSFRARDILQQSSFCDAAVSLRGPDRQCSKDDSLGMSAQEQVETIDSTPGTNYEWTPRACSKETAACLSLLQTSYNPRQGIAVS